jgi:Isochorismatase family
MLADPRHSRVVLINRTCGGTPALSASLAACRAGLSLLRTGLEMFAIPSTLVGACEPFCNGDTEQPVRSMVQLDVDVLSIWQDQQFADVLASSETRILFLGGGWLEEEIFIAALQGAQRGYDVRLLSDAVVARVEADRPLVFDRLALHGILATTVRQTLLEWAVCLNDPLLKKKVQRLLS